MDKKEKLSVKSKVRSKPIVRAEDVVFKFINKKYNLSEEILNLVSVHKLSAEEITSYLVEKNYILETEKEIYQRIKILVQEDNIAIEVHNNEEVLAPQSISTEKKKKWDRLNRNKDKQWINSKTILNSFFRVVRSNLNNKVKILERENINSYYKIYNPTEICMEFIHNEKKGIMFSSNDYLGLSKHPEVIEASKLALDKFGLGACGSRVSIGTNELHIALEREMSSFKQSESCIIFSSGYLTNLTFFSMLTKDTVVFYDALDHASIIHGCLASGNKIIRFKHNDSTDLEKKISPVKADNKLIIIESLYSLDGDIANIVPIANIAKKYKAHLAVDEAHSTGTLGFGGKGICSHFNMAEDMVDFKIGTFSKALGSEGGFLCAKKKVIDAYKYTVNPYLFTASRSPGVVGGTLKALEILKSNPDMVLKLQKKAQWFRETIKKMGFDIGNSLTHVVPIMLYKDEIAHKLKKLLENEGVFLMAVIYPTVPKNQARLRVNISLAHTKEHLNKLIYYLELYGRQLGII